MGDKRALHEIARILKVGGKVIITVPFGKRFVSTSAGFRAYDYRHLRELLSEFEIEKIEYAINRGVDSNILI